MIEDEWIEDYTPDELAAWVSLLIKRSQHRGDDSNRAQDVREAAAYMSQLRNNCKSGDTVTVAGEEITIAELEQQMHEAWVETIG